MQVFEDIYVKPLSIVYIHQIVKLLVEIVLNATFLIKICASRGLYSMCSLAVSTQDSPAVEPRLNPGLGKILMSENLRLYTTSPVVMF